MKAKEYYQKYHDGILSTSQNEQLAAIQQFLDELMKDFSALNKARGGRSVSAVAGAVSEINQKYNAVLALFEKNDGVKPMVDNGFSIALQRSVPELVPILEMDRDIKARRLRGGRRP